MANKLLKVLSRFAEVGHPLNMLAGVGFVVWFASSDGFERWTGLVGTGLLLAGLMLRTAGPDDESQQESQARVREAERDLEEALRGTAVARDVLVEVDHRDDAEPGNRPRVDETQSRLTLSELWAVTHRRLDHYHGIALAQAKLSFRYAQIAMGLGFALLVAFVILAFNASTATGSVVTGALGAVSAALAGYVSRTFIRSQEAAAGHLRAYFDQPLEFSRYLAAERLLADAGLSDEKRAEVLSLLVQTMINGQAETAPTNATDEQLGKPS